MGQSSLFSQEKTISTNNDDYRRDMSKNNLKSNMNQFYGILDLKNKNMRDSLSEFSNNDQYIKSDRSRESFQKNII